MGYVTAGPTPAEFCVFCALLRDPDDRRALILHRGSLAFLVLNAFPYASGHLMAVVSRHVAGLVEATPDELAECMTLLQSAERALRAAYTPDGFNMGLNLGRVAGAGVVGHLHFHLVPRWSGDTNFMPVIGDTRVLPESLDVTYDRLAAALRS
jgi:ATP adenylyltransferase